MLLSALKTSLAILFFRAGPQDMPFDNGPSLVRETVLFTAVCYAAFTLLVMPVLPAMVLVGITIAAQALAARTTVEVRKMPNRYQQTLVALLLTNAMLAVVMLPVMLKLAPSIADLSQVLQAHPDWATQPDKLPSLPAGPLLALLVLGIWQFVVSVRVFGQAVDVGVGGAILIALVCGMGVSLVVDLTSAMLQQLSP